MSRCRHEDAQQSHHMDDWLYCPDCRHLIKKRETDIVRFAEEGH